MLRRQNLLEVLQLYNFDLQTDLKVIILEYAGLLKNGKTSLVYMIFF